MFCLITTSIPSAYADDMKIEQACTGEGWSATITDIQGNPLVNVRVGTLDRISSSSPEESFYTDENGYVVIPHASITGFVKVTKGGYNDQKFSISCEGQIGFLTYQNNMEGFQLQYPSDWVKEIPPNPFLKVVFVSPSEYSGDVFFENVMVGTENLSPNTDLEEYTKLVKTNTFSYNTQILESRGTTMSGHPAHRVLFIEDDVQALIVWTIVDSKAYFMAFNASTETFSKYEKVFDEIFSSFQITTDTSETPKTGFVPTIVAGKYSDVEAGIEIEFPQQWTGFSFDFPQDGDMESLELSPELAGLAEIYSGMTLVMVMPAETGAAETLPGVITLTVMDVSTIETLSNFISGTLTDATSQPIPEGASEQMMSTSQPDCDISSPQTVITLNGMKTHLVNTKCDALAQGISTTISIYTFLTNDKIINVMYTAIHDFEEQPDFSEFEKSLNTLKIQDTIDISQPSEYAKVFGLEHSVHSVSLGGKNYDVEFVSDSTITNFSYNEKNNQIIFVPIGNKGFANTEIHTHELLQSPYSVTIDGKKINDFFVTEDLMTMQNSISLTHQLPINEIKISGNNQNLTQIPDWIKNNAGWWAQDAIGDSDFTTGIQFLIKEGIITVPEIATTTDTTGNQDIPSWIKNNADWWSQGLISDDDFLKGIQFLVENGIIVV
ncbi:MAG: hypothetical protein PVG23_05410 [Nitrosopumilaceae archaeon]|jgi:hypothetical protein